MTSEIISNAINQVITQYLGIGIMIFIIQTILIGIFFYCIIKAATKNAIKESYEYILKIEHNKNIKKYISMTDDERLEKDLQEELANW